MGGTAVSFWIISIAMIACTVFLFAEAATVKDHWKTSLHVGGLVTLVAGVHYMYMREYWVQVHKSPIVYRYIDWTITVPLQMIEFNLILKAAGKPVGAMMFWRLLVGTVVMLAFGYAGETGVLPALIGFVIGMAVGDSSSTRSSPVRLVALSATAPQPWPPTSRPCASLSPLAGPSTLSDMSSAHSSTCQVRKVSLMSCTRSASSCLSGPQGRVPWCGKDRTLDGSISECHKFSVSLPLAWYSDHVSYPVWMGDLTG